MIDRPTVAPPLVVPLRKIGTSNTLATGHLAEAAVARGHKLRRCVAHVMDGLLLARMELAADEKVVIDVAESRCEVLSNLEELRKLVAEIPDLVGFSEGGVR